MSVQIEVSRLKKLGMARLRMGILMADAIYRRIGLKSGSLLVKHLNIFLCLHSTLLNLEVNIVGYLEIQQLLLFSANWNGSTSTIHYYHA